MTHRHRVARHRRPAPRAARRWRRGSGCRSVGAQHVDGEHAVAQLRHGQPEAAQLRRPAAARHRAERLARGQRGGDRREDVAAVEGRATPARRRSGESPMSTASATPPGARPRGISRPLSGPTSRWSCSAVRSATARRACLPTAPRRDRRPRGGRRRAGTASADAQHERARAHVVARDRVGEVDHPCARAARGRSRRGRRRRTRRAWP